MQGNNILNFWINYSKAVNPVTDNVVLTEQIAQAGQDLLMANKHFLQTIRQEVLHTNIPIRFTISPI